MQEPVVRVAIISRSQIVRAGLIALLGGVEERLVVVDTVSRDGASGSFDVAVFDLDAPDQCRVINELKHVAAVGAPVVGLVYRFTDESPRRLGRIPIVDLATSGAELVEVLRSLVLTDAHAPSARAQSVRELPDGLTARELEVLRLIANGASNLDVAAGLYLSVNSVKTYVRTGYRKIGASNRAAAILWGTQHGLIDRRLTENH